MRKWQAAFHHDTTQHHPRSEGGPAAHTQKRNIYISNTETTPADNHQDQLAKPTGKTR